MDFLSKRAPLLKSLIFELKSFGRIRKVEIGSDVSTKVEVSGYSFIDHFGLQFWPVLANALDSKFLEPEKI